MEAGRGIDSSATNEGALAWLALHDNLDRVSIARSVEAMQGLTRHPEPGKDSVADLLASKKRLFRHVKDSVVGILPLDQQVLHDHILALLMIGTLPSTHALSIGLGKRAVLTSLDGNRRLLHSRIVED